MNTENQYKLPCKKEDIIKSISDPIAHYGKFEHAIDFILPAGSPVFASCDGEVVDIQEGFKEGGADEKYREKANYITIKHKNHEFSEYVHLKYKSAKVEIGDEVKQGDLIALSGNTGQSTEPHLHFHVFGKDPIKSLEIQWGEDIKISKKNIGDREVKYFEF